MVDRSVLRLIRGWLKAPIVEEDDKGKRQPPRKSDKGTPQGGVISPLLANLYLHWFDKLFHRADGPFHWANARLVRYADDFVVLSRYQGSRLKEWVRSHLEDWLGLELNREKTSVVNLRESMSLDFLGYTFRYDWDLKGRNWKYLHVGPSKKSQKKAREVIRQKTGSRYGSKPSIKLVEDLNEYLRGWSQYFQYGYSRRDMRGLSNYTRGRMHIHLNRRSQRKYHRPQGFSEYHYLHHVLGLIRL